jgi:hypothetical protein
VHDQLNKIAADARLIGLAALGLSEIGNIGEDDMNGIINLADRIQNELVHLAKEIHPMPSG